jgi:hypothetical protein
VATCSLTGESIASVKAFADARAKANLWVSSYFDAVAEASNCKTCKAFASSWGYIEKWVFLEAIARAEVAVCYVLDGRNQQFLKDLSTGQTSFVHAPLWAVSLPVDEGPFPFSFLPYRCDSLSTGQTYAFVLLAMIMSIDELKSCAIVYKGSISNNKFENKSNLLAMNRCYCEEGMSTTDDEDTAVCTLTKDQSTAW